MYINTNTIPIKYYVKIDLNLFNLKRFQFRLKSDQKSDFCKYL